MFYAKAMLRDTLKVVEVSEIDFCMDRLRYTHEEEWLMWTNFDNIVWLECNSRPIEKKI